MDKFVKTSQICPMESVIGLLLKVLPKNWISYFVGVLVQLPLPAPINQWAVKRFASHYNINLEEAEYPVEHYQTIGDLFTRKLKPGMRPIAEGLVHPADAMLTSWGKINGDELIQAKGKTYSLAEFVSDDNAVKLFKGGHFVTYYLCPTDYHRVHSPVDGKIVKVEHVPGYLWPVNEWSVNSVDRLFAVNERVIVWIQTPKGLVALVMVGATNVGKMTMSFDSEIVSNMPPFRSRSYVKTYPKAIPVSRGQEVGIFNMGSTVIMVYPEGYLENDPISGPTRVGQSFSDTFEKWKATQR